MCLEDGLMKPPSSDRAEKNDQRVAKLQSEITRLTAMLAGLSGLPRNAARAATVSELEKKIAAARKALQTALSSTIKV